MSKVVATIESRTLDAESLLSLVNDDLYEWFRDDTATIKVEKVEPTDD